MLKTQVEVKLKNVPEDAISSVKFAPKSNQFILVGSWDSTLRFYDFTNDSIKHNFTLKAPILDVSFQDIDHFYCGGLDNQLTMFEATTGKETVLGRHDNAIRCIEYCSLLNGIITGSWDSSIRLWDQRQAQCCGNFKIGAKVYALSVVEEKLVVGASDRKVIIYDVRNLTNYVEKRESGLKYQTRAVRVFPNRQGYVMSSIEGRVAFEYFDPNPEVQKKKYAFKCHRNKTATGSEVIYPVNAISFHSVYNTFATGGSDGIVNVWDGYNKKRLCQFYPYNTHVASLCFSHDGEYIAVGCSYLYDHEVSANPTPENAIYVRKMSESEVKPK